MFTRLLFAAFGLSALVACQTDKSPEVAHTETITYTAEFNVYTQSPDDDMMPQFEQMMQAALDGKIDVYNANYWDQGDRKEKLTIAELQQMMSRMDTLVGVSPTTLEDTVHYVRMTLNPNMVKKMFVCEEWDYDARGCLLDRRLKFQAPVRDVMDPTTGRLTGRSLLFLYYPEDTRSVARTETVTYLARFDANTETREDDTIPGLRQMFHAALEGEIVIHDANYDWEKEAPSKVLDPERFAKFMRYRDTIQAVSPKTLEDTVIITEVHLSADAIDQMYFCEEWDYDANGCVVERRLKFQAPVRNVWDRQTGQVSGGSVMFHFYPELQPEVKTASL